MFQIQVIIGNIDGLTRPELDRRLSWSKYMGRLDHFAHVRYSLSGYSRCGIPICCDGLCRVSETPCDTGVTANGERVGRVRQSG